MAKKIKVAPSILSANFSKLGEEIKKVTQAGADWIHIDVMDGVFVPNITIGPCVIKSVREKTDIPFDVHLMIDDPLSHIESFSRAGADIITFHIEASREPRHTIAKIREYEKKVGISIKPKTPISRISAFLNDVDMVLIMTVEPGSAGQAFMKNMLPKIESLRRIYSKDIEVDGGIDSKTVKDAIKAGANIIVAGTSVFGKKDYRGAIKKLRG